MTRIRWIKVISSAGFTFTSTLLSLLTFDAMVRREIPFDILLYASFTVSGLTAATTFFKELLREDERVQKNISKLRKLGYANTHISPIYYKTCIGKTCWRTKLFIFLDHILVF